MEKISLSMLKGQETRTVIPCYFQDELIGDIEIKNPTNQYAKYISDCAKNNMIDDDLRIDMLKTLTNIDIDCELDDDFMKHYNDVFNSVMIEIDSIIFEIATNYALEMYVLNKMPDSKKEFISKIVENQDEIVENIKEAKQQDFKKKELMSMEEQMKLLQEKITSLKGE